MAPLPKTQTRSWKCRTTSNASNTSTETFPSFARIGWEAAEKTGFWPRNSIPIASGARMNTASGRAMLHGLACRPGIISGNAKGIKSVVPTVRSVMSATAKPRSPRALSTSLGRNGAPAAPASRSRPIACGRSRGIAMVRTSANTGATKKFRVSVTNTSRTLHKGARIARGVRLRPAESMLLTRNASNAIFATMRAASIMWKSGTLRLESHPESDLRMGRLLIGFRRSPSKSQFPGPAMGRRPLCEGTTCLFLFRGSK